jgi:NitT/TauT family transport system permease protein
MAIEQMRSAQRATVTEKPQSRRLRGVRSWLRQWLPFFVLLLGLAILWEALKLIGGQALRIDLTAIGIPLETVYTPPLRWRFANNLNMPHLWDIAYAFVEPARRGGPPLIWLLLQAAQYTFLMSLLGFAIGAVIGLTLAVILVHSDLLSRAFVPYIIASQTIPILIIAPMIVIWLQSSWLSVATIAAYLTFFPVTISALRGLRSIDESDFELMRSYAATPLQILLKLRLPAAVPYLFVGFKIAATASVIGTVVGELPSGVSNGLGSAVLNFSQYYSTGPEKLWACIVIAAALGITSYTLVYLAEVWVLRGRDEVVDAV